MTNDEYEQIQPNNRDASYGPGFFKFIERDHGWSNLLFGDVLFYVFRPVSVVEFGCGTGATLAALHRHGVKVAGLDASQDCIPFVSRHSSDVAKHVVVHDMAVPWTTPQQYDLAVSIEMLEHVPTAGADVAVATICRAAPRAIVTACPPVGRNPLHLNEQPFDYWVAKFRANGRDLDMVATTAVRDVMRAFYALYQAGRAPVVPTWYFSDYIGVFA